MIDSVGDGVGVRADGCWRLMAIQTRGCMTTAVRLCDDRRREQQRQLATYVGVNDGDVVGFGDTRLGEDTSGMEALMRSMGEKSGHARHETQMPVNEKRIPKTRTEIPPRNKTQA